ncbi:MAG: hypothetical protein DRQ64_08435 [Gammaproteobacteria bacterium]|nr:MAG: hypothetical protein DRQ64_08435 [Gammaproteobacteria bacterium]
MQPHFFAGQLLTDDDLQALTNYTVTKHRLHNRYVVGSGVSCGLAITCHPCGNGKVIVQPGYAIDCCGNEIHVPCPVELDINAMVRDLNFKRLGHDCGDPCAEPMKNTNSVKSKTERKRNQECADLADRYCLYLRYCEQPTDPITPYTQDETCATTCQPSRIREGFSFELRCPEEEDCPPSLFDRICCCIGDLGEAEFRAQEMDRVNRHVLQAKTGLQAFNQNQSVQFTDEDVELVNSVQKQLAEDASLFQNIQNETIIVDDVNTGAVPVLTEKVLRRSLDNIQTLGSVIVRWDLTSEQEKLILLKKHEGLGNEIEETRTSLLNITPIVGKQAPKFLKSPIELAAADTIVNITQEFIKSGLSNDQQLSIQTSLYAHSVVSSTVFNNEINDFLMNFKNWLLRKMLKCPPTTECCLVEEVECLVIPTGDQFSAVTIAATDTLVRAFIRYLIDCICSALIPPCPTCEDPAVKLACLEIKDCKIDNICNLERTFLLTEHNLRYWLPFLHGFGEILEKICCEFSKKFDKPILDFQVDDKASLRVNPNPLFFVSGQQISKFMAAQSVFPNILRLTGLPADSVSPVINFSNSIGNIAVSQRQFTGQFEQQDKLRAVADTGNMTLARILEQPQAKAAIQMAAEKHLSTIEKQLESVTAESLKLVEEIQERSSARIRDLEEDVSKRVTTSRLASTKVIKDLQNSLDEQMEVNETLVTRLDKLEKDAKK